MKNFRRFLPALAALFTLLFSAAGSLAQTNAELGKRKTTPEECPEIIREIQTYESVKNLPDVQKRLKELTKSSNQRVKDAAKPALTPIDFWKGF